MKYPVLTTKTIRQHKRHRGCTPLHMLTCYDFQMAQLLEETPVDMLLVGDSLGNVVLGMEHTISVTLSMMSLFGQAVRRGAPNKFLVLDLPFGSYGYFEQAIDNATLLFQQTQAQAIKLEGADPFHLEIIKRLIQIGIPVMGHIGLRPQSVHQQGGFFRHGKNDDEANLLLEEAIKLEQAGAFSLVLECVHPTVAENITKAISIPTIGIGSGTETDGQVLVTNDLLGQGKNAPPAFVKPIAQLYELKKNLINQYLQL
jgi:3-methyl-2-oxobutanoate hydroxymethyltransferase